jgi:CRISPR/Cas system-associated exonuclease Cas4 (RecB family)
MALPASFVFSQASLQDYADCPRRFQLRYVLQVRWPASHEGRLAEWERRARQGTAFHRLVHQHTVGVPAEALEMTVGKGELRTWWQAYLTTPPRDLPGTIRQSEVHLVTPLAGHRLTARYDLVAVDPGRRAVIVDWKTSQSRPRRAWLEKRVQTQVYRYVLVEAGAQFNGKDAAGHTRPFLAEQVELIYWFANFPRQTECFSYSAEQHRTIEQAISAMIAEIAAFDLEEWPLTTDQQRCRSCLYKTLCDREDIEGSEEQPEDELEQDLFDMDLEQIAEIEF